MNDIKVTQTRVMPPQLAGLMHRIGCMTLAIFIGLWVTACGPVQAVNTVDSAIEAVDAAETAEAEKWATYEYWLAVRYLEKARRIVGYAQYEAAETFAKEAVDYATLAVKKSGEAKRKKSRLRPSSTTAPTRNKPSPKASSTPPSTQPKAKKKTKKKKRKSKRSKKRKTRSKRTKGATK